MQDQFMKLMKLAMHSLIAFITKLLLLRQPDSTFTIDTIVSMLSQAIALACHHVVPKLSG